MFYEKLLKSSLFKKDMEMFNGICHEGGGSCVPKTFFFKNVFLKTIWNHSLIVKTCFALSSGFILCLSSPSAKRTGPKGLRAESARAVTGRRCPHSGKGEDFLTGQPDFFMETAVTPERKVKKWFPRWEINSHAEG